MLLNVEADEIIYRCAFAVQRQGYSIVTNNGSIRDFRNTCTKTQIVGKLIELGKVLGEDYQLNSYTLCEPVSNCLAIAKHTIRKLQNIGEVKLWLSPADKSNFRFAKAVTPGSAGLGYKAGRGARPRYYQDVRDYLITYHGAEEIEGYEADDALGIYQTKDTVAVHIDKDINMIPGRHLNWVTQERYVVPEGLGSLEQHEKKVIGRGLLFFYFQMLTGDSTDNIPGIPRVGIKRAYDLLTTGPNWYEEQTVIDKVRNLYYNTYKENWYDVMLEVADLLWIVRADRKIGSEYLISRGLQL